MITGIKIIDKMKIIFGKLRIGYNKDDKSVTNNYIDNSTNIIYLSNTSLPPDLPPEKMLQLSDEKLGKVIKKHTMKNFEAAYKEKPKEMEEYLTKCNLSALSLAGTTTTTENLIPWLTGETRVEPLEPMPSGDFIEQLPNAIDKITVSEKVDIKMEDKNKKESS